MWIFGTICTFALGIYDVLSGAWIANKLEKFDYYNESHVRYIPYDYDPNFLQIQLPMALLFSFYYFQKYNGLARMVYLLSFIIIVVEYFLTASKMAFLTILLLVPFFLFYSLKKSSARTLLLYGLVCVFIIYNLNLIDFSFFEYNLERYQTLLSDNITNATSSRNYLFDAALEIFYANPAFGLGLGNTTNYLTLKYGVSSGTTHNSFLHILSEFGIVGFVLYVAFIKSCLGKLNFRNLHLMQKITFLTLLPLLSITAGFNLLFIVILGFCYRYQQILTKEVNA
jgi:O-antigen ligase